MSESDHIKQYRELINVFNKAQDEMDIVEKEIEDNESLLGELEVFVNETLKKMDLVWKDMNDEERAVFERRQEQYHE